MGKKHGLFLIVLVMALVSCNYVERNMKAGDAIVEKIEEYKNENDTLPISLAEMGQEEIIDGVMFCYEKKDSIYYIVWFGTTLGEGMYYFSDTREWENQWRIIPKVAGKQNRVTP